MARGRKRARAEDAVPAGGSLLQPLPSEQLDAHAQPDGAGPADAPQEGLDRREDMAAVARRSGCLLTMCQSSTVAVEGSLHARLCMG